MRGRGEKQSERKRGEGFKLTRSLKRLRKKDQMERFEQRSLSSRRPAQGTGNAVCQPGLGSLRDDALATWHTNITDHQCAGFRYCTKKLRSVVRNIFGVSSPVRIR